MIRSMRPADCDAIAAIEAQTFNTAFDRGRLLAFLKMQAFCGFVDDPNINIPNTQAKGISIYHCPFTTPNNCPGVSKVQDLIFGLSEPNPNLE